MSNRKCPFCNGELVGTIGHPICRNQNCVMCDDPMPQDLLEELIRTRKALDVAKDTIRHADWFFDGDYNVDAKTMHNEIKYAIKAITALEQKDK